MKRYLFVDLDDTLFQTPGKCPPGAELTPAAYYTDGRICSYMTRQQRELFALLSHSMTLIPTSARSQAALQRVELPFGSYAIVQFGGLILMPEGHVDPLWRVKINTELTPYAEQLFALCEQINRFQNEQMLPGRALCMEEQGLVFYVNIKDPDKQLRRLDHLQQNCIEPWLASAEGQGFYLHRNGNNLAVLPKVLNKSKAVNYLCERLREQDGEILTFGLGDSLTDAQFMAACDYAIVPTASQLAAMTLAKL